MKFDEFMKKNKSKFPEKIKKALNDENQYGTTVDTSHHGAHSIPIHDNVKKDIIRRNKLEEASSEFYNWLDKNDNQHLGDDVHDVHLKLSDDMPHDDIPEEIKGKIHDYTINSSDLNRYLLKRHSPEMFNDGHEVPFDGYHHRSIKALDKALEEHRTLPTELNVYHGASFDPGEAASRHPENRLFIPAFTSTSIQKQIAHSFSPKDKKGKDVKHIIHFHLNPGQKGLYLGDNSHHQNEKEYLLPRHISAKIHPEPDVIGRDDDSNEVHVWHAYDIQHHQKAIKPDEPEELNDHQITERINKLKDSPEKLEKFFNTNKEDFKQSHLNDLMRYGYGYLAHSHHDYDPSPEDIHDAFAHHGFDNPSLLHNPKTLPKTIAHVLTDKTGKFSRQVIKNLSLDPKLKSDEISHVIDHGNDEALKHILYNKNVEDHHFERFNKSTNPNITDKHRAIAEEAKNDLDEIKADPIHHLIHNIDPNAHNFSHVSDEIEKASLKGELKPNHIDALIKTFGSSFKVPNSIKHYIDPSNIKMNKEELSKFIDNHVGGIGNLFRTKSILNHKNLDEDHLVQLHHKQLINQNTSESNFEDLINHPKSGDKLKNHITSKEAFDADEWTAANHLNQLIQKIKNEGDYDKLKKLRDHINEQDHIPHSQKYYADKMVNHLELKAHHSKLGGEDAFINKVSWANNHDDIDTALKEHLHKDFTPKVIKYFDDKLLMGYVASSPHFNPNKETMTNIIKQNPEYYHLLTKKPEFDSDHIDQVLSHPDSSLSSKIDVLKHPKVTEENLHTALDNSKTQHNYTAVNVALHPKVNESHLHKILKGNFGEGPKDIAKEKLKKLGYQEPKGPENKKEPEHNDEISKIIDSHGTMDSGDWNKKLSKAFEENKIEKHHLHKIINAGNTSFMKVKAMNHHLADKDVVKAAIDSPHTTPALKQIAQSKLRHLNSREMNNMSPEQKNTHNVVLAALKNKNDTPKDNERVLRYFQDNPKPHPELVQALADHSGGYSLAKKHVANSKVPLDHAKILYNHKNTPKHVKQRFEAVYGKENLV